MHPDIEALFHHAEEHYLQPVEIKLFRHHAASLALRLQTYECLREQEIAIFQPIADQLQDAFSNVDTKLLEQALKQWLAVMRYASMAMLLSNSEFLHHRLLEWLTEIVQTQQTREVQARICQLLQARLKQVLPANQLGLIQPLIDQAQITLLGSSTLTTPLS
jgi:hypothetical protein